MIHLPVHLSIQATFAVYILCYLPGIINAEHRHFSLMSWSLQSNGEMHMNQTSAKKCELAVVIRTTKENCIIVQEQVIKELELAWKEKEWIYSRDDDGIDIRRISKS